MRKMILWSVSALIMMLGSIMVCFGQYDKPIDSYYARLSEKDHFNSNGQRLTTISAIIRQDRANFHEYGYRDPDDDDDIYFTTKEKRARIENMALSFSSSSPMTTSDMDKFVNGTPLIFVRIYRDRLDIELQ